MEQELIRWGAWFTGSLMAQVFDPIFWISVAIGAGLGKTRRHMALGVILVTALTVFGWLMILEDQFRMGNGTPPTIYAVTYFVGKFLGFALGLAFNRVMQRIEKRSTRVLEKART